MLQVKYGLSSPELTQKMAMVAVLGCGVFKGTNEALDGQEHYEARQITHVCPFQVCPLALLLFHLVAIQ